MVRVSVVSLAIAIFLFALAPLAHRDIVATWNDSRDPAATDSDLITLTYLTPSDDPLAAFSKMVIELPDSYGYPRGEYYDGNNRINTIKEDLSTLPVTWGTTGFEFSNPSLIWEATGFEPWMDASNAGGAPQFSSPSLFFPAMFGFPGQGIGSLSRQKDNKAIPNIDSTVDVAASTPEPSSLALMLAGVGLVFAMRKRYAGLQQAS